MRVQGSKLAPKIHQKSMPRRLPMLTSFFDRFLMGFCSQLRPPEPHGSSPRCSESTIYQKFVFRNSYRFFIDFGTNMLSFSLRKSTKIDLKIDRERHQFFYRFLHRFVIDFGSILEAHLAPCWQLFRSKWVYAVVSSPLFAWVDVLIRVFSRPDPPLAKNVACRLSISNGFRLDFGMFWAPFWKFLVTICPLFGVHFLHNLRINLNSFLK